ncbi:putative Post-SET domain-containing protein [Helianthus anomalus]
MPEMETDGEEDGESDVEGDGLHGEPVDCEELHGEPVDCEELHGEINQPLKTIDLANMSHSPYPLENVCEKVQPTFDLNKSLGSFSVGSTKVDSVNRTRKRPCRCRSPSCEEFLGPEGHDVGPGSNYNPLRELIKKSKVISVDPSPSLFTSEQNNEPVPGGNTEEVHRLSKDTGESNKVQDSEIRAVHLGTSLEPESGESGMEAGDNRAEKGNGDLVSDEVRATMEVGNKVGVQLDGFINQVSELIKGEGVQNPAQ